MNAEFEYTGHFYELDSFKLRKYLNIKRAGVILDDPDLMVVMMNPGSSLPVDGIDNNVIPSEARPDRTQDQITIVMDRLGFNYARILNLSDLRTPNSKELYRFLKSDISSKVEHSIFFPSRLSELKLYFVVDVPVIFGWGVDPALVPLARLAIQTLCIRNPLGILKPKTKYSFYHPLQRGRARQHWWVNSVISQSPRT